MTEVPKDVFEKVHRFTCRMNEAEQRAFHEFKQKVRMADNESGAVNEAIERALKFIKLREDVIADIKAKKAYYGIFNNEIE